MTLMAEPVERRVLAERKTEYPAAPSTQSEDRAESGLLRLRTATRRDERLQLNNLLHHVSVDRLRNAYLALNRKAATGVDDMSWEGYGVDLESRLHDLHCRLHTGRYRAQPSKRIWIPKANGQQRPIGVAALEDKIVQQALVWVLETIFEEDFLGFSYGFRPGRSQHRALDALYMTLTQKKVSWVLDADIQGFFDELDHEWLMQFISHRVSDKRVLNILVRTLRAGVEEDGQRSGTRIGTPQGAVISPLLANIYLHYVLDLWVHQWRQRHARGEVYIVRYADDFALGFQYQSDGHALYTALVRRLTQFGLRLHPDKTRLIEFGRFAQANRKAQGKGKPETFDFLGFTHICAVRRDGCFTVRRHTIAKRQRATLLRIKEWLRRNLMVNVHDQGRWLRKVLTGLVNYYGVPGNGVSLQTFRTEICRHWCKALRRRGNKRPISWVNMTKHIKRWIPTVRIVHPYPNQRWCG
ncbi:RNA-directed DNA polymerase [Isoalcanivorax pacificus W11-5]|uniref:RNA-directed DNA polymerase n=1 Tax=Isoalcanivorax pacificus W11-5 TaxID=391936 RepID=A0A0B4XSG6_9GAMM|nr:group II intron reverse transcriptase/maturase [Isoalcanivorax pacificus]AJD49695.1 RNA-directed DNA polymerase [Isoalcanivorax pacificus W11-5]